MSTKAGKSTTEPHAQQEAILRAAFEEIAERGWTETSMLEISQRAEIDLATVFRFFPAKAELIDGLSRHADQAVLAADHSMMADESARNRLFDVLMQRFDALEPYKPGFRRLRHDLPGDPCAALLAGPALAASMARMLEVAGLSASGLRGLVRVAGLTAIWVSTARVWLRDDSPDLAQTMAALDKALQRGDEIARSVEGWTGRATGPKNKANGAVNGSGETPGA